MRWLIVLNGKHWRDISPVVFGEHHRNPEWSITLCEHFDSGGSMIEMVRGETKYYVPHGSVVVAVHLKDSAKTMGFIDSATMEKDGAA